uniref:long-chain-fatty-acid--CoA ligase n=1 Tax=Glossina morsitans morsitans TaxID=37546 RepID=A0A1B0GBY8_GLOMM
MGTSDSPPSVEQQHLTDDDIHPINTQHITIDIDVKTDPNESPTAALTNECDDLSKRSPKSLSKQTSSLKNIPVAFSFVLYAVGVSFLAVVISLTWYYMNWTFGLPALALALLAVFLTKPGWRWFYIAVATSKRDLTKLDKKNLTIADIFQKNTAKHPDKIAIVSETQTWTFRNLNEFSNQVANVFLTHGYKKSDVVGVMLGNCPEYVGIWLGLSKIGVITALINTNLRGQSLLHSIAVAKCTAIIYGETFAQVVDDISKKIPSNIAFYQINDDLNTPVKSPSTNLTSLLKTAGTEQISAPVEHSLHHDKLLYIYTSGTTGLPKAAVISHSRYIFIAAGIHYTLGFKQNDIFYTPLPLYHTAGGIMSMGQALLFGCTVAIRRKFSASGYFVDCFKYNATVGQYIGEMARYILATPLSENDRKHKVRMVFGNGLRPQIWPRFTERFNITKVGEFYGATEGNANIMNHDNTVGAIGFVSRILPHIYPISIIRADPDTGEPIRGPNGLCQLCKPQEPGVFIGKIVPGNPAREFLGYVDENASAKKVVCDVFKKGDMAFISGDLLVSDEKGYLYFIDRTGDTFRWKGENVSTGEVESQLSTLVGYRDTIVYGVTIPNTEGRAGMAAIYDPERQVDLDSFTIELKKVLPVYARPQFLRFLTKIDLTGTFKLRKIDLQKEGYDPNIINDPLYYQTCTGKYEPISKEIYGMICRNELKF